MRWGRSTLAVLVALVLGAGACADAPSGSLPAPNAGSGKADSDPNVTDIAASTMQALPERPGMLDVVRDPAHQWSARLIGPGGDIYLASASYQQEISAINAILGIKESGVFASRYQPVPDGAGACTLELRAANNHPIATSPVFASCAAANASIQATRELVAGVVQFEAAVSGGARFALWRAPSDRKWYFAMRAADERVLLESQAYSRRMDAITGLTSVRTNGKLPERYRVVADDHGVSISLKAANHHEIARSGPYPLAEQAQAVIDEAVDLLRSERVGNPW